MPPNMSKQAFNNVNTALEGNSEILMKKAMISFGKNYTVMDQNQKPLMFVRLDAGQNVTGSLVKGALGGVGRILARRMSYTYRVNDANDQNALEIRKGTGAYKSQFDVVEPDSGDKIGVITMKRGFIGGMQAHWQDPKSNETLLSTRGNVMRRKYVITGPAGNEVAKVRHKIAAIRDVWKLELSQGTNHLHSVIFASILDFEKEM